MTASLWTNSSPTSSTYAESKRASSSETSTPTECDYSRCREKYLDATTHANDFSVNTNFPALELSNVSHVPGN